MIIVIMTNVTTVTQKGQITLPLILRKMLAIKPYDRVLVKISDGRITIEPVKDILDLAGAVPVNSKINAAQARSFMVNNYSRI